MEKSQHSEEAITRLGKKIVHELTLDESVDTLNRWIAHYVAELITETEECSEEAIKRKKQKECTKLILKLWRNRAYLSDNVKPLNELSPLIEILETLKKHNFRYQYWEYLRDTPTKGPWADFINTVRDNSENIFKLSMYAVVDEELVKKKEDWIKYHREMLSEEESSMIEHLKFILKETTPTFELEKLSYQERMEEIFRKVESEIDVMSMKLNELKKAMLNKP